MLLGILVVAAVGCALAFKSAKNQTCWCGPTRTDCHITSYDNYTTDGESFYQMYCSTQPSRDECQLQITDNQLPR